MVWNPLQLLTTSSRLVRLLLLVMTAALFASGLYAADPSSRVNQPTDELEQEAKSWATMQADAAEWVRNRARATPEQKDDAEAARYLARARELLVNGHEIRARWWAEDAFDEFPYSKYAGDALRMGLEGAAVQGNISQVREKLQMLWLYVPDYPGMSDAMDRAMSVAEDVQDFTKAINLAAEKPSDVIDLEGRVLLNDTQTTRLMRFLAVHGDRETIAPRAALGLARGLLLVGGKEDIYEARRAYERFLESYPNTYLTFTALCEYALSYLVAYRGDDYDIGTLVMAAAIIDQAEVEARGDADQVRSVQAYRARIRGWHQDRDLSIARWYRARGKPWVLQWLKKPPQLQSWEDGSRYFYQEVIKRDSASSQGRQAEQELADVALGRPDTLGRPTPANGRR